MRQYQVNIVYLLEKTDFLIQPKIISIEIVVLTQFMDQEKEFWLRNEMQSQEIQFQFLPLVQIFHVALTG